ncbi:hypothetical protein [Acinetobacter seifertii]|uniref:hypothetical protein n=1 Tax=Acinetobacter seifertii TaxID=1530123 RepID=UPI003F51CE16
MQNIKMKDDTCHFFTEQDITNKQVIKVCFDISDFERIQEVYDFFGEKIYGNNREYLNDIHANTKQFGRNLSAFHDYLRGYLIGISSEKRNEVLSVTVTNNSNKNIDDDWLDFFSIILQTFFDSHKNIKYGVYMDLVFSRSIVINMMDYFIFLISDYKNRPKDELDDSGNYV